jgi:hypothetical protein
MRYGSRILGLGTALADMLAAGSPVANTAGHQTATSVFCTLTAHVLCAT